MSRTQHDSQVCNSKTMYDTEWEAELASAKITDELVPYRCPGTKHYHLTHMDREQRRGAGRGWKKCACGEIIKTAKRGFDKHVQQCEIMKEAERERQHGSEAQGHNKGESV